MTSDGGEVQHSGRVHYSRRMYVRAHGMMDVLRRGNLAALLLPLALLGLGAAARARLTRKTVVYRWHGVELAHPAGWTEAERSVGTGSDGGESVVLTDLLGPGRIKPRLTLRITPAPAGEANVGTAAAENGAPDPGTVPVGATPAAMSEGLVTRLPLYYEIGSSQVQIGSIAATRIDAAFAFTPRAVPGRKGDIPVVMRSIDFVVLRGTDALSIQLAAPLEDFEAQRPVLEAIVASLRLDPAAGPPPTAPGNEAQPVATESASDAVTVTGQVVDAESGLAVPGAIVVFLAPGTGVDEVDDDNLTSVAYTTGLADSEGHFASTRALSRAAHYAVMVVADGYRWIGSDDGVTVDGEAPEQLDVGAVRLRRR